MPLDPTLALAGSLLLAGDLRCRRRWPSCVATDAFAGVVANYRLLPPALVRPVGVRAARSSSSPLAVGLLVPAHARRRPRWCAVLLLAVRRGDGDQSPSRPHATSTAVAPSACCSERIGWPLVAPQSGARRRRLPSSRWATPAARPFMPLDWFSIVAATRLRPAALRRRRPSVRAGARPSLKGASLTDGGPGRLAGPALDRGRGAGAGRSGPRPPDRRAARARGTAGCPDHAHRGRRSAIARPSSTSPISPAARSMSAAGGRRAQPAAPVRLADLPDVQEAPARGPLVRAQRAARGSGRRADGRRRPAVARGAGRRAPAGGPAAGPVADRRHHARDRQAAARRADRRRRRDPLLGHRQQPRASGEPAGGPGDRLRLDAGLSARHATAAGQRCRRDRRRQHGGYRHDPRRVRSHDGKHRAG